MKLGDRLAIENIKYTRSTELRKLSEWATELLNEGEIRKASRVIKVANTMKYRMENYEEGK